jgi:hypothetical protein|eukprot:COSAG01_NODE_2522_length_7515_cov_12.042605_5_plen_36_part_00
MLAMFSLRQSLLEGGERGATWLARGTEGLLRARAV